jgi:hypothetical protein
MKQKSTAKWHKTNTHGLHGCACWYQVYQPCRGMQVLTLAKEETYRICGWFIGIGFLKKDYWMCLDSTVYEE